MSRFRQRSTRPISAKTRRRGRGRGSALTSATTSRAWPSVSRRKNANFSANLPRPSLVKATVTKTVLVTARLMSTPPKTANTLLHGALDALILKTLTAGPSHGYAIARSIEETTGEAVLVEEGSLYPALYRLQRGGGGGGGGGVSRAGPPPGVYRPTH